MIYLKKIDINRFLIIALNFINTNEVKILILFLKGKQRVHPSVRVISVESRNSPGLNNIYTNTNTNDSTFNARIYHSSEIGRLPSYEELFNKKNIGET